MPKILKIRPVLLSAPYARSGENLEVDLHLKSGFRTTGLVEIMLDNGIKGLGEGYLAVFAPKVFTSIVELITPHLLGREIMNMEPLIRDLRLIIDYWSLQGAARHVYSAFEIALNDCRARILGIPVYQMIGGTNHPIELYGSGGDSPTPHYMILEFKQLEDLGITKFKIRARKNQTNKVRWCIEEGEKRSIDIAVDMTQNLADPGQSVEDVTSFYQFVTKLSNDGLFFLEESLGAWDGNKYPALRKALSVKFAGGEIVTTPQELINRIEMDWYDIAQPDATVIGGVGAVLTVFKAAVKKSTEVMVHCWGGPIGMMANYHAALAGGGAMAEWPMPQYPLRDALVERPWQIEHGMLHLSDTPGLGVRLTEEVEQEFKFREDAIYNCLTDTSNGPCDTVWNE